MAADEVAAAAVGLPEVGVAAEAAAVDADEVAAAVAAVDGVPVGVAVADRVAADRAAVVLRVAARPVVGAELLRGLNSP